MKVALYLLFLTSCASAITKEVVRVFQPISYHDTDSVTEYGVKGELVQAAVLARQVVLSGAFPEDLIHAVAMPFSFATNNATYEVEEANLLLLCGIDFEVELQNELLEVTIDCSELSIPEAVELSPQQILQMTIESIRRTVRIYYQGEVHEPFQCDLTLQGLGENNQSLSKLETSFRVGPDTASAEEAE